VNEKEELWEQVDVSTGCMKNTSWADRMHDVLPERDPGIANGKPSNVSSGWPNPYEEVAE
jgi:hypothetical protein